MGYLFEYYLAKDPNKDPDNVPGWVKEREEVMKKKKKLEEEKELLFQERKKKDEEVQ